MRRNTEFLFPPLSHHEQWGKHQYQNNSNVHCKKFTEIGMRENKEETLISSQECLPPDVFDVLVRLKGLRDELLTNNKLPYGWE